MKFFIISLLLLLISFVAYCQTATLVGRVSHTENGQFISEATMLLQEDASQPYKTDAEGRFRIVDLQPGKYQITVFAYERKTLKQEITLNAGINELNFALAPLKDSLDEIVVEAAAEKTFGITRLNAVEGFGIYEGKKNEVIILDDLSANKAANNARQIFAKVPGLNIWESDCAGLQLDIAARGLGPSRTANFNTRQNGYDMSADAIGYPESYYTPPTQALERIEIVRGAASLQYGPQFGGMLNFVLKDAPKDKKFQFTTEQTYGSFNFLNTFNSIGGTLGKFKYYSYYQYKRGDCWRPNSGFDLHNTYTRLGYAFNDRLSLDLEYTWMHYQAQQPGGLLDIEFQRDPRISKRERNWFQVDWNLAALTLNYRFSDKTRLNIRNFATFSGRDALGNLERIDRIDLGGNRTLIQDDYLNFGTELRLIHQYSFLKNPAVFLTGFRYYNGHTDRRQGDASAASDADFKYLNPNDLEGSDYELPGKNYSFFIENIFNITDKLSVTPGIRVEHIRTFSEGYYKQRVIDFAGNIVSENTISEESSVIRTFALLGLGLSYKYHENIDLYANISQNFRPITFSDLRIDNPNFVLDSAIVDEKGYNIDLGIRGNLRQFIHFDVSLFYLRYNDRIGFLLVANQPPLFLDFRFRTNVGDSRHYGLESFVEADILGLIAGKALKSNLLLYSNFSWIDAQYVKVEDNAINGRKVEYVPNLLWRSGLTYRYQGFQASFQLSYLSEQFTDATNARGPVAGAVSGLIPSYHVMDLSLSYQYKFLKLEAGLNNLSNQKYFTRRAESYPGPGIIPSPGRSFYVTLQGKF
ncbi:MAG: TonB-dependent receptor [Microscillaceae bacterium]|nr:TonB-dependent receptor [Microscillaceae bacterium]